MSNEQTGPMGPEAQAYRDKLFKLLGDQDPLEIMAQTASTLTDIIREHPVTVLRTRPSAGKWSPTEVIGHLVDSEWVYGFRVRLILCEDKPTILGMDQDLWVAGQRHNDREPSELSEQFRTLREFNLSVWKRMSTLDLDRVGQHNERGQESLGLWLKMFGGHDLAHLAQITRSIKGIQQLG